MNEFFPIECADSLLAIGSLVKNRRLQNRQRQKDLAASLAISERTVRKIEAGDPSVELRSFMLVLWQLGLTQEVFQSRQQIEVSSLASAQASRNARVRLASAKGDF
ncbi:transcriptional regulator [Pseudomonas sp. B21-054]|uniref:transcriptional regulator n=1 Tax=Pseudomonas sp. B21-054 TaxID=2895494 RepID=UPI00222EBC57|nr:transcriptional regulator [Pseudomonas sp. B21-054]UZE17720.1 transcriptional regulator [Pseudomonas sp. B21-054]